MAKSFHICKWIYFAILTFAMIEEKVSGQQLLRQIVLTYARIIYILVCTTLALPWGLFAIFAHHHYYVDHVPCTFFTVGWHSLVTTNSQTKLMPFWSTAIFSTCLRNLSVCLFDLGFRVWTRCLNSLWGLFRSLSLRLQKHIYAPFLSDAIKMQLELWCHKCFFSRHLLQWMRNGLMSRKRRKCI